MKTIKLLFCFSFFIFSFSLSFGQSWGWGRQGYGNDIKTSNYGSSVATDRSGNCYFCGQYYEQVVFDGDIIKSGGVNSVLVKFDSIGNFIWAVQPTNSSGTCYGNSVATDKSGNIYLCGYITGVSAFGTYTLTCTSGYCVILVKFSPSGTVLWAKQSNSYRDSYNYGNSVATDMSNNVFSTGYFEDTISFGTDTLENGYSYSATVFLVKYDSVGNVLWARQSSMPSNSCSGTGTSLATDNMGNAYMAGYFKTAIFFDSYQLISLNNY
jgi:hypothetical protein